MAESTSEQRERAVLRRLAGRRPGLVDDVITLAHGAGGRASAALVEAVFAPAFANPALAELGDAGVVDLASDLVAGGRLALTTDSYVVKPLRFPGGSIGHLAVHGTVNDLAVSGAVPRWLTAGFVLEEGLPVDVLRGVVADMADAAANAGVQIVAGDTKVVPRGAADGLYVTTAGVGVVPAGRRLGPQQVAPGDVVLLSGPMAAHGMAVLLARGDLALSADIASDTAPLHRLVAALLAAAPGTRWLRDATRGGVGTVCVELAAASGLGVLLDERRLPVDAVVAAACDLLGIDPLHVANEGVLVAVVPADQADAALAAMATDPAGARAVAVGEIVAEPAGVVGLATAFGGTRIVDALVGDPLPRIC